MATGIGNASEGWTLRFAVGRGKGVTPARRAGFSGTDFAAVHTENRNRRPEDRLRYESVEVRRDFYSDSLRVTTNG